ncbi:MAG: helix-turn-helix transcriptional regulator [Bacillota bacterium]
MRVSCRLSAIMGEKRLKMTDVVRGTGLGRTTVWNLYHDRATRIGFDVLAKLCRFLDCQPGDLLVYIPDEGKPKGNLGDTAAGKWF